MAREELSIAHTRVSALGTQSLPRRLEVAAALTFETADLREPPATMLAP